VVSKVSKVLKYPKNQKNKATWSTFSWDAKGNLQTAKNHLNKAVKLFYDTNGRISTMIDQSKRRIDFKYNENSKPIVITDPALGSINVTYDNAGAVTKVESAKGDKVAVQIFDTFQNLIEIIRPAGVTLSF
jgi:YD repeat-containing protein